MAAISTCLSSNRPPAPINGDILFETDTQNLIIWDTSLGAGLGRWLYHGSQGFQFPNLNTSSQLLNYDDLKTPANTASPYYLTPGVSPQYHLDARFIDGFDPANNPADGTLLGSVVNRSNASPVGALFKKTDTTGPEYRIIGARRVISGRDSNASKYLDAWESDGTTQFLNSQPPNTDWTFVHISQRDFSPQKTLSFPSYNNPSQGMVGHVFTDLTTNQNAGWVSQGLTNLRHRFYSQQARATDAGGSVNGYAWTSLSSDPLNKGLFQTDPNLTDPEKGALLKNLFGGYGYNEPQLWILETSSDGVGGRWGKWYMNGNNLLAEAPQSANDPKMDYQQYVTAPGKFVIAGYVMETMFFGSTLSVSDKNKILAYAIANYGVGANTVTPQF